MKRGKSPVFQFKQFAVRHDRAALRITTDATVLGALVPVGNENRILDLGTGCGVIALMLAQRSTGQITCLDIEPTAIAQAQENVAASPWAARMACQLADVRAFEAPSFDLIVSNPPYFEGHLPAADFARNAALHDAALTLPELAHALNRLLTTDGSCWLCLPPAEMQQLTLLLALYHLHPCAGWQLAHEPHKPVIRVFRGFRRGKQMPVNEAVLYVRTADGEYDPGYARLLGPYFTVF